MSKTRWILFLVALPTSVIAYCIGLFAMACWLAKSPRLEDGLVLSLEWRPWVTEHWHYSTALFRVVFYQPGTRRKPGGDATRIERHEHVHVRQAEDDALRGLIVGCLLVLSGASPIVGLVAWALWPATLITNLVTAMLRWGSRRAYRDAEHERSAYAQTDKIRKGTEGLSWGELREKEVNQGIQ